MSPRAMLPAALRDSLIGGMLSDDPAAQVAAAGRIVAFEDSDPVLIADLPADTLTRARTMEAFAYPGLPPARIVLLASEEVARQGEEAQEAKEEVGEVEPSTPSATLQQQGAGASGSQVAQAAAKQSTKSVQPLADPWPQSPVSRRFRDEIHKRESQQNNYQEFNPAGPAYGRYQITKAGLIDAGFMKPDGSWTGGVKDGQDFLNKPKIQEQAFANLMKANEGFLKNNGSTKFLSQQIDGVKAKFKITMNGLLAAAHREGSKQVRRYLEHQKAHGWKSDPTTFPKNPPDRAQKFLNIETRLRKFENISHKAPQP